MINCIIVDDDLVALNVVKHYVTSTDGLNLLQVFSNAVEAGNFIKKNTGDIDLVLLDVEMPELNGLQLAQSLKGFPPVIFITGSDKYALQAFDQQACNYLLKPLEYSAFLKAISRFMENGVVERKHSTHIFVKENGVMTRVKYEDILYFEAQGDYVKVHTKSKVHLVNSTMRSIEDKLRQNDLFVRIHRTFHINIHYLESFDSETAIVSNRAIPIGQKFRPDLQNRLMII